MMYWFLGAGFWWGITLVLVALSVGKSLRWAKTGWLVRGRCSKTSPAD